MKLQKLSTVLDGLVELRPNPTLGGLAKALRVSSNTATVAQFLTRLQDISKAANPAVEEVADTYFPALDFLSIAATNFGTATSAGPVVALIKWLREHPDCPTAAIENAALCLATAKAARPKPTPVLNPEVSAKHANALLSAVPGTDTYGQRLEALKADKVSARVIELEDIARRLGLTFDAGSSRPTLLKRIAQTHDLSLKARKKAELARGNSSA